MYFIAFVAMDCELMQLDYIVDQEEFFNNDRKRMSSVKDFVMPIPARKTVNIFLRLYFIHESSSYGGYNEG